LFARSEATIDLLQLGIADIVRKAVTLATRASQGLILLCGGTNTGKSTTIAGAINEHVKYFGTKRKRISIEQPVERFLPGLIQVNVREEVIADKVKVDGFELTLRGVKRHDPDVIWVGEIRDRQSGEVAVASASSGHLVFATLHANDPFVGYSYLSTIVESDKRPLLIESLSIIVGQRLVKRVCPHCGIYRNPKDIDVESFLSYVQKKGIKGCELPEKVIYQNPAGCEQCGKTGAVGIIPVNEVLPVTDTVKQAMYGLLRNENVKKSIDDARLITFFDCAMDFVNKGMIELESAFI